jgi:hypothetical protein
MNIDMRRWTMQEETKNMPEPTPETDRTEKPLEPIKLQDVSMTKPISKFREMLVEHKVDLSKICYKITAEEAKILCGEMKDGMPSGDPSRAVLQTAINGRFEASQLHKCNLAGLTILVIGM